MQVLGTLKSSNRHRWHDLMKLKFGMHLKADVLPKGLTYFYILAILQKEIQLWPLVFSVEMNRTLKYFIYSGSDFTLEKPVRALHSILSVICTKGEEYKHMHAYFLRCVMNLSFLLYFYYVRLIRALSIFFYSYQMRKTGNWSLQVLCKMSMKQIMANPFAKNTLLWLCYGFWLRACISCVWWTIFECKVCASKLKIDERSSS